MNIKLTIAYDGTPFHGWQIQPNGITVQEILKKRIDQITGENIKLIGASRTDSGVHAIEQVANFKTNKRMAEKKWVASINALLPPEIVVQHVEFVPDAFHARYSSLGKAYSYHIGYKKTPFLINRQWIINQPLKLPLMKKGLAFLKGKHDFSSFTSSSSKTRSKICHIKKCELIKKDQTVIITLWGNRFLTHMVRTIVGTLVKVGLGKIKPDSMKTILEAKDRSKAGPTVPPCGLYLLKVYYPKN